MHDNIKYNKRVMTVEDYARPHVKPFLERYYPGGEIVEIPSYDGPNDPIRNEIVLGRTIGTHQGLGTDFIFQYEGLNYYIDLKAMSDDCKSIVYEALRWTEEEGIKPGWVWKHEELPQERQYILHMSTDGKEAIMINKTHITSYIKANVDIERLRWVKDKGDSNKWEKNVFFYRNNERQLRKLQNIGGKIYRRQKEAPTNWQLVRA